MAYTRGEVLFLLDKVLERPDMVMDFLNNENTNISSEDLLIEAEGDFEKLKEDSKFRHCKHCDTVETCVYKKKCGLLKKQP